MIKRNQPDRETVRLIHWERGLYDNAGLSEIVIPVSALFGIALLGIEVDIEQAIALLIAIGPGEDIHQRP